MERPYFRDLIQELRESNIPVLIYDPETEEKVGSKRALRVCVTRPLIEDIVWLQYNARGYPNATFHLVVVIKERDLPLLRIKLGHQIAVF